MGGPSVKFLELGPGGERRLVEELRRGEPDAYRHLYDAYAPRLTASLRRILRDGELVKDAVQVTFLAVYRNVGRFEGHSSLATWITRIGIREAIRLLPRAPSIEDFTEEPVPSPEQLTAESEVTGHLESVVGALPIEKRLPLVLFELEGFSVQEIADILDEPRGTILARLSRTRHEVRARLEEWLAVGEPGENAGRRKKGV